MKKSFPVNINGRIYNIDEDAYALLKNYLDQLRATFPGAEGHEIMTDIEGRVAELFDERLGDGTQVIDINDVNRVIAIMGRPEDLGDTMPDEHTGASADAGTGATATPPAYEQQESEPRHKLYRNIDNKMMGGVLSGLAAYFGTDPNLLRVLMIILTVCTAFWPCFIGYLIAWAVIPPADTPRRRLELRGEAVSVEAVGRGVLSVDTTTRQHGGGGFAGFLDVLAKCVMGFVGLVAGMVGLAMTVSILCLVGVMIALPFSAAVSAQMVHLFPGGGVTLALICATLSCLMILLPCIALLWLSLYVVFGVKGCSTGVIVGALVVEVLIFVTVIVLSLIIGSGSVGYWWWQHI